jgi:hypothetical protein
MPQQLKKYQRVKVSEERGTWTYALILGILEDGRVLVDIDNRMFVVDREDIQS